MMNLRIVLRFALVCLCLGHLAGEMPAQTQTVGLFNSQPGVFPGYTLFSPLIGTDHFLIDNCGQMVHQWETDFRVGNSIYLLEDGRLLKTAQANSVNSSITGAGGGERVQILSWEGELLWDYNPTSERFRPHHDIEPMPNGNVLIIAWEELSLEEATALGRERNFLPEGKLWPEVILEVRPIGPNEGEIVWEWHQIDHIIQDEDPNKPDFGQPRSYPERWDINFVSQNNFPIGEADWIHFNSIDYSVELDQILLSSQRLSEIYIIDHSTTVQEAAGHTGGRCGKGGDILYRWGNPEVYGRGEDINQLLYGQHDAQWIPDGVFGEGNILVLNNGNGQRPWTTVDEITPPVLPDGNYEIEPWRAFAPNGPSWTYSAPNPTDLYSGFVSGSQRLPNGNTLVCAAALGFFFEVDRNGNEVFRYMSPATHTGPITQGDSIPPLSFGPSNIMFRAEKYAADFSGFGGRDLSPKGTIELEPIPTNCRANLIYPVSALIYPNPAAESLSIELENVFGNFAALRVYNLQGKLVWQEDSPGSLNTINLSQWESGLYVLRIGEYGWKRFVVHR